MSQLETLVFTGPPEYEFYSQYRALFGGWLYFIQNTPLLQTPIPYFAALLVGVAILRAFSPIAQGWLMVLALATNVMLSFRLGSAWDEFYLNLKHSWVFRESGSFSYNLSGPAEATVDFLPYLLAGMLGKLGLPLEETVIGINLSGNIIILLLASKIWQRLNVPFRVCDFGLVLMTFFPPTIYIGTSGFTAGLFSATILLGTYLWMIKQPIGSIGVLAMLPLIRVEGIIFNFVGWVVISYGEWRDRGSRPLGSVFFRCWWSGVGLVTPFLVLSLWRFFYFGSFLPNPVIYKNTHFDLRYLEKGVRQLRECMSIYNMALIGSVLVGVLLFRWWARERFRGAEVGLMVAVWASIILTAFYYLNGGDWFPVIWARYCMPALVLTWVLFVAAVGWCAGRLGPRLGIVVCLIAFALVLWPNQQSAFRQTYGEANSSMNRWPRVEILAAFGQLLKQTSSPGDVIASSEVATTMYFAERDLLDLLGVANREIAMSRVDPIRGFGDTMHMRRNPETIRRHKPQFICYYGSENVSDSDYTHASLDQLVEEIKSKGFDTNKPEILFYRIGHLEGIKEQGYRHVSVFIGRYLFAYFVSAEAFDKHCIALRNFGMKEVGKGFVSVEVPEYVLSRFKD